MVRGDALGQLVLVGMAPFQQAQRRHVRQQPGQFVHLRQIALAVKRGPFGIQPAGQEVQRHVPGALAQGLGVRHRRQPVVVRDEQKGLALLLQLQGRPHHPEIVPDVQLARGLNTRQNSHDPFSPSLAENNPRILPAPPPAAKLKEPTF